MTNDRPPTEFVITAHIRIAAREGIPITVRRRGDNSSGSIVLMVNRLDGTARVLTQVRYDGEVVWSPVGRADPLTEDEAEAYLERQARIDPDLWLVEIEDKQGRHWFPGRVMSPK